MQRVTVPSPKQNNRPTIGYFTMKLQWRLTITSPVQGFVNAVPVPALDKTKSHTSNHKNHQILHIPLTTCRLIENKNIYLYWINNEVILSTTTCRAQVKHEVTQVDRNKCKLRYTNKYERTRVVTNELGPWYTNHMNTRGQEQTLMNKSRGTRMNSRE